MPGPVRGPARVPVQVPEPEAGPARRRRRGGAGEGRFTQDDLNASWPKTAQAPDPVAARSESQLDELAKSKNLTDAGASDAKQNLDRSAVS